MLRSMNKTFLISQFKMIEEHLTFEKLQLVKEMITLLVVYWIIITLIITIK